MTAVAIIALVVVIAVGLAMWAMSGVVAKSAEAGQDPVAEIPPGGDTLLYRVPTGQDPAAVVAALSKEGYDAVSRNVRGKPLVVISASGEQREEVRKAIRARSGSSFTDAAPVDGTVRFEDE